jgi:hypothetical protein
VVKKLMILVTLTKIGMQINWANVIFNNLHSKLRDLGGPHKIGTTGDAEFGGTQILDILFWKWFLMHPNFRLLNFEEDESEENLPSEARRRNLPPGLGT